MVHVNDQTVNGLPQCPMGGLGQSGNGSRFGSFNSRANSPNGNGSQ
jgi:acyl-CoA reductase-like NAD-dependent aldehyde dehydrogenase